jgi:D-glycero-D-manno-heptose 1,7-bisphosphate phosphatase
MKKRMLPAIFLDRDGVVIENVDSYIRSWEQVCFLPGALEALAQLAGLSHRIIIVTNQSAVGRGMIDQAAAEDINQGVLERIHAAGGRIDGLYMCPHSPEDGCSCRKPLPGLFVQAAQELDIDLPHSVMIGDALTDLMAGQAAGIGNLILLRTGRGAAQERLPLPSGLGPFQVFDSLAGALPYMDRFRFQPFSLDL